VSSFSSVEGFLSTGLDRHFALREVEAPKFRNSRQMKVATLSDHAPAAFALLLFQSKNPWYLFLLEAVRGWVDLRIIVWPEGLCQCNTQMNTSGIKPATFRLAAQLHRVVL